MTKFVLWGLFVSIQFIQSAQAHNNDALTVVLKEEMSFTSLFTSVQLRGLQVKLESLCKLTKNDCFVNPVMFDAVPAGKTTLEISNSAMEKVFGKPHSEKSDAATALKLVLKHSGIKKSSDSIRIVQEILTEIKSLSKTDQIEIASSILYSPVTNERAMTIILRNKKFQSAEVITFGAGNSADTF